MVEERAWQVENEGNLARTWEQRLKPKTEPHRQRARRRAPAGWVRPAAWIGGLWAGAVVASFLAIQVMTMSYHYDQMNQEYSSLVRQNQSLQETLASLTSVQALSGDAARLKVSMIEPKSMVTAPVKTRQRTPLHHASGGSVISQVTGWMEQFSQSLGR